MTNSGRPLSPHLTVYRPLIGAFTSILHRAMNTALFGGCLFFAAWLLTIALGGEAYATYARFWQSWIGQSMLLCWTFAAIYSAAQWLRHLAWDLGYGFELEVARRTAWLALWGSSGLTLLIWSHVLLR